MRRFMVFTWVGFAALSAVFMSLAVVLDFPNEPAKYCQAKWADAKLAARSSRGTLCEVYVNGAWVPEADVLKNPKNESSPARLLP